jgi:hypothetical protein
MSKFHQAHQFPRRGVAGTEQQTPNPVSTGRNGWRAIRRIAALAGLLTILAAPAATALPAYAANPPCIPVGCTRGGTPCCTPR